MYKNEFFQSSETKNEYFQSSWTKTKLIYSLWTKSIFWPFFLIVEYSHKTLVSGAK